MLQENKWKNIGNAKTYTFKLQKLGKLISADFLKIKLWQQKLSLRGNQGYLP